MTPYLELWEVSLSILEF